MPRICVMNESTAITDAEVMAMIPAFEEQWNRDLESVWGVEEASFEFVYKGQNPAAKSWWCVFLDNSDQAGALAYHDLTSEGLPISKIFVKTLMQDNSSVSVGATHELCEMAVDPWLNSAYQDDQGTFWAGEVCDPCEDGIYGYKIGSIEVTDFVAPSWFGHQHAAAPYDFKGHVMQPFQVLSGGYAQKFDPSAGWVQVTGDRALASHQLVAPAGSRRDRRERAWAATGGILPLVGGVWQLSAPARMSP